MLLHIYTVRATPSVSDFTLFLFPCTRIHGGPAHTEVAVRTDGKERDKGVVLTGRICACSEAASGRVQNTGGRAWRAHGLAVAEDEAEQHPRRDRAPRDLRRWRTQPGFIPCTSTREDGFVPCNSTREDGFVPCNSTREDGFIPCPRPSLRARVAAARRRHQQRHEARRAQRVARHLHHVARAQVSAAPGRPRHPAGRRPREGGREGAGSRVCPSRPAPPPLRARASPLPPPRRATPRRTVMDQAGTPCSPST